MRDIPHHLLDCIELKEAPWSVSRFVEEAGKVIRGIRARGKLPILVGGTHYYVQSLLFHHSSLVQNVGGYLSEEELIEKWPVLGASGDEMLQELRKVDPDMAAKWHPRDIRKIRRSLEIWLRTGIKASAAYAEQHRKLTVPISITEHPAFSTNSKENGESSTNSQATLHPGLRYNAIFFWLHADVGQLRERIDSRVDNMIKLGLLAEIRSMEALYHESASKGLHVDPTKGIWVSIGFKEFKEYLNFLRTSTDGAKLQELVCAGIEKTKIATRQYAKRQVRWIRRKLLNAVRDVYAQERVFLLDCEDMSSWGFNVERIACDVTDDFLAGKALPHPRSTSDIANRILEAYSTAIETRKADLRTRVCDFCNITVTTDISWQQHLNSKKHKGIHKHRQGHSCYE